MTALDVNGIDGGVCFCDGPSIVLLCNVFRCKSNHGPALPLLMAYGCRFDFIRLVIDDHAYSVKPGCQG